jgi:hypothetical protein
MDSGALSGFIPLLYPVLTAGAKAKTVTSLFNLTVLLAGFIYQSGF